MRKPTYCGRSSDFQVEEVLAGDDDEGLEVGKTREGWRVTQTFETEHDAGGKPVRGFAVLKWVDEALNEDARSVASEAQLLSDHTEQVVSCVLEIAGRLQLPGTEVEALATAARLHDEGKAALRWQGAMNAPTDGRVLCEDERRGQLAAPGGLSPRVRLAHDG